MDVFALRNQLIADYASYVESFIAVQDERIRTHVEQALSDGALWPDPLIQLNPSFQPGAWIDDLAAQGVLHPLCREIFRVKSGDGAGKPLRLHKHQTDAIDAARSGDNYVLTTGTGSGKSLAYIIPIVDYVLQHGSGKGIQAIVVYPMNALANSQFNELEKFLCRGFPAGKPPVTFRRYTGQESEAEKAEIIANPPDILLTNYVMLELVMTRPNESKLVRAARGFRFLVLDELHTYRGRQGADVALLVRRVRQQCHSPKLQCIGTSATLADKGTFARQQEEIAEVAARLFGATVKPERIIGETLQRATTAEELDNPDFKRQLTERIRNPQNQPSPHYPDFINDPLSIWIETTFGLTTEAESGRLCRARPLSITGAEGAARQLSEITGLAEEQCAEAIQTGLLAGYKALHPETGFPSFAFRLHQFISKGDTVYTSLEEPDSRYITLSGQQFVPDDRRRVLLPMVFCRECGQEYYLVYRHPDRKTGKTVFLPRELRDQTSEEDDQRGFLYQNPANPWPDDERRLELLPEDWLEEGKSGRRVKSSHKHKMPVPVRINMLGVEDETGAVWHFVKSPFSFCLNCGVTYGSRQQSDFGKLTALSSEGRSTATTVLSLSALQTLKRDTALEFTAKKLLSFTDNRQDASLQAGHFNDFVEVGLLRAALFKAVQTAGRRGLAHDELAQKVFEAVNLPIELYATDPAVQYNARRQTELALREVLAYRIYYDLRRGWRVTAPNLEQCGLLKIDYVSLDDLCRNEAEWQPYHQALATATPEQRKQVAQTLLDFLRRELAIKVDYLDEVYQERIQQRSSQRLIEPWAIDDEEKMEHSAVAFPRSRTPGDYGGNLFVSGRSGLGIYLRRPKTFPLYPDKLSLEDTEEIIPQLFEVLQVAGLVETVAAAKNKGDLPGYQIPADAMVWLAGDGITPTDDPIRMPRQSRVKRKPNTFFSGFYRQIAAQLGGVQAKEHTAQVPADERRQREEDFRNAKLPLLYCSPTMELGVDIAQLNVVNMRNVPPTPANYAQRSGRAGRSGQPALVFTYCTIGSPHDQYFFKRPDQMVAGAVSPPRLDLANEDLILAHVYAVWLTETGQSLGSSLKDILDLSGDPPKLDFLPSVLLNIQSAPAKQRAATQLSRILQPIEPELQQTDWYTPDWLEKKLALVVENFDRACDRWRSLYLAALKQQALQHEIIKDASRSPADKNLATRLRAEAEAQLRLLTDDHNVMQSDFYSYRYFAGEGFLPGYNFPRLPLSAYLPGRRGQYNSRDEFLSRPRFLAISEFGPQSIIYHEGSRYVINKVILPVGNDGLLTTRAKLCPECGYLHHLTDNTDGPDRCEHCHCPLELPLRSLFQMQNVATKRRDRINSDEEERTRMGYELKTGVRFNPHGPRPPYREAILSDAGGKAMFRLTYGDAATIWRINLGWRRRKNKHEYGFWLDTERGFWEKNRQEVEQDPDDPNGPVREQVIPFAQDKRNCLLIEPYEPYEAKVMASLQPALKNAIQVAYQLEDNELAAEPLPSDDDRRVILLYESAEGGAGVLRQLIDNAGTVTKITETALRLCHFDPTTGVDLHHAPTAKENCEAACYDCLMSYYNQRDHQLLDRRLIRDILLALKAGQTKSSPVAVDRKTHLEQLKALCDSDLEKTWLDFLEAGNLRLPEQAQKLMEDCRTRVDFFYSREQAAIYIDGPVHDQPDIAADDVRIEACLTFNLGLTVIRFRYDADWAAICRQYAYIFGKSED